MHRKRAGIIQSFKQIYGNISPRGGRDNDEENSGEVKIDHREKKVIKRSLSNSFILIMKQWKLRATLIKKLRSEVAGLIESTTGKACEFCGKNYCLRAELVPNIESIYIKFLQENPDNAGKTHDIEDWQEVFKKNALIRTLCFDCSNKILDHHRKTAAEETRLKRNQERRRKTKTLTSKSALSSNTEIFSKKVSAFGSVIKEGSEKRIETREDPMETEYNKTLESSEDELEIRRNPKVEAKKKILRNENLQNLLKIWLADAKSRINPPATFR